MSGEVVPQPGEEEQKFSHREVISDIDQPIIPIPEQANESSQQRQSRLKERLQFLNDVYERAASQAQANAGTRNVDGLGHPNRDPETEQMPAQEGHGPASDENHHGGEDYEDDHHDEHHEEDGSPYYEELHNELLGDGHHNIRTGGGLINLKPEDYKKLIAQLQENGDIGSEPAAVFDDNSLGQRGFRSRGKLRNGQWRRGSFRVYEVNDHDDAAVVVFDVNQAKTRAKGWLPAKKDYQPSALAVVRTAGGASAFDGGPTNELKEAIIKQRINLFLPSQKRETPHGVPPMPELHPDLPTDEQDVAINNQLRAKLAQRNDVRAAEVRERQEAKQNAVNAAEQDAAWKDWQTKQFNSVRMETPDYLQDIKPSIWPEQRQLEQWKERYFEVSDTGETVERKMSEAEPPLPSEEASEVKSDAEVPAAEAETPAAAEVLAPEVSALGEEALEESPVREPGAEAVSERGKEGVEITSLPEKPAREFEVSGAGETTEKNLSDVVVEGEGKKKQSWPGRPEAFAELVNRVKEKDEEFGLPPHHKQYNYEQVKYLIDRAVSNEELKALEGDVWRRQELNPKQRMFDYNPGDHNLLGVTGKAKKIMEAFKGKRIEFAKAERKAALNKHVNKKYAEELARAREEAAKIKEEFEEIGRREKQEDDEKNTKLLDDFVAERREEWKSGKEPERRGFDNEAGAAEPEAAVESEPLAARIGELSRETDRPDEEIEKLYNEAVDSGYINIDDEAPKPANAPEAGEVFAAIQELYAERERQIDLAEQMIDRVVAIRSQEGLSQDEKEAEIKEALAEAAQVGLFSEKPGRQSAAQKYFAQAMNDMAGKTVIEVSTEPEVEGSSDDGSAPGAETTDEIAEDLAEAEPTNESAEELEKRIQKQLDQPSDPSRQRQRKGRRRK